jgi:hypothetical protein
MQQLTNAEEQLMEQLELEKALKDLPDFSEPKPNDNGCHFTEDDR